jgi:DNA-binding MarR family transcriptional regulator
VPAHAVAEPGRGKEGASEGAAILGEIPRGSPPVQLEVSTPRDVSVIGTVPAQPSGATITTRLDEGAGEPVRLSQRILIHLAREGAGAPEGTVSHSLCQQGIAESLGITQGAMAGVLRRLVVGGAVVCERAHVEGHDRRLNVYRLAPRGQEIVRRLLKEYPGVRLSPARSVPRRQGQNRPARHGRARESALNAEGDPGPGSRDALRRAGPNSVG